MEDGVRYLVGLAKACGAGADGSPGFQLGNTCAAERGGVRDEAYAGRTIGKKAVKLLRKAEAEIKGGENETAVAFSSSGERVIYKGGWRSAVVFTDDEVDAMRGRDLVFTHNHPSGNSFSVDDILMARTLELSEMRAVSPDGTVYRLRQPDAGWAWVDFVSIRVAKNEARDAGDRIVRPKLEPLVRSGELSAEVANRMHTHWEMVRTAKTLGLKYERVLGEGVEIAEAA